MGNSRCQAFKQEEGGRGRETERAGGRGMIMNLGEKQIENQGREIGMGGEEGEEGMRDRSSDREVGFRGERAHKKKERETQDRVRESKADTKGESLPKIL